VTLKTEVIVVFFCAITRINYILYITSKGGYIIIFYNLISHMFLINMLHKCKILFNFKIY